MNTIKSSSRKSKKLFVDSDVDLTILPSGEILIHRRSGVQNAIALQLFSGDDDICRHLAGFFSLTEHSELLFGDSELCG